MSSLQKKKRESFRGIMVSEDRQTVRMKSDVKMSSGVCVLSHTFSGFQDQSLSVTKCL